MHIDYLIRMANDIGAFFANDPDHAAAVVNIHQHIRKFWDPRMRTRIVEYYNDTGGTELEGPVKEAVQKLAQEQPAKV